MVCVHRRPASVAPAWVSSASQAYTDTVLRARLIGERLPLGAAGWIVPLIVTFFAAVLRFTALDHPHRLIFDETYYVKDGWSLWQHGYEVGWEEDSDEAFARGEITAKDEPSYVVHPPLGKWLIGAGVMLLGPESGAGWRLGSAVVGTASVLLVALIAQQLFRSVALGGIAGLLMAVDGHHLVMSRTGLLDIFLSFFVLAAFGAMVMDRDAGRRKLARLIGARAEDSPEELRAYLRYGPWLGWRPWRILAGILLGAACSVKLSGLAFVAVFGLMIVCWDIGARRTAGIRRWFVAGVVRDGLYAFVCVVVVGAFSYLITWSGWIFTAGGFYRQWGAENPAGGFFGWVPDWLRGLIHYHSQSTEFHSDLSSGHNYASSPWTWPFMGRPVSFHYVGSDQGELGCAAEGGCSEAILDLANPLLWWSGLLAMIVMVFLWLGRRDWRAGAILGVYVAGQLVWALWPARTMFFFYTIAYAPFLVLAVTMCLGLYLRRGAIDTADGLRPRKRNLMIVLGFVLLVVLVSAYFMPLWTGQQIPYDSWRMRMWFDSWI
ncbi:MAG: dolichyl-phosphate-mannose--protein mannosyltransferase [Micrococcaceae bacterium]